MFTATCLVGLLATVVPNGQAATPVEGDFDPGFGLNGTAQPPAALGQLGGQAQQADGKVVVASYSESVNGISLVRYTRNGAVDDSFGESGVAEIPDLAYGPNADPASAAPTGLTIDSDGRLVVVGVVNVVGDVFPNNYDLVVARFTSAGDPDTSFDGDGVLVEDLDGRGETADGVVTRSNNKIVVVGDTLDSTGWDSFALQLKEDGTPDDAFDGDGFMVTTDNSLFDNKDVFFLSVALGANGGIVTGGSMRPTNVGDQSQMLVVRLTATGGYDTSFSGDGVFPSNTSTGGETIKALRVLPSGSILAAGSRDVTGGNIATVIRVKPAGGLDFGFSGDGIADTAYSDSYSGANALALQRDGNIVVAGQAGPEQNGFLARFTPNGSIDPDFGNAGYRVVQLSDDAQYAGISIQRTGRIVVSGSLVYQQLVQGFIGDATPPSKARLRGVHRWALAKATIRWSATDDNTGVKSYSVQRRSAAYTKAKYGSWSLWNSTTAKQATFTGKPGHTYCFRARARDYAGNVGGYGATKCLARPLDERKLSIHGSWGASNNADYYRDTALSSTVKGASLTLSGARWRHLAVVVTTCPNCGSLDVFLGSKLLKTLDLSASLRHRKVMSVAGKAKAQSGDIRLVVHSSGHPVTVEGLGVSLA
jgi:uncharacterized delta-60 repeat protein